MKQSYRDIVEKCGPPRWWDESGVPRYCEPDPDEVANIYAQEVAFCVIYCQSCRHRFLVAFSQGSMDHYYDLAGESLSGKSLWIAKQYPPLRERLDRLHYGDPPAYFSNGNIPEAEQCCHCGATMNSEMGGVVKFFHLEDFEWVEDKTVNGLDLGHEYFAKE